MRRIVLILLIFSFYANSQQILPERARAAVVDEILADRFNNLLPKLMDRTGIDMWILISREYNEDPVLKTMLPATWLNARRRTIILFYRDKEKDKALYDVVKKMLIKYSTQDRLADIAHGMDIQDIVLYTSNC